MDLYKSMWYVLLQIKVKKKKLQEKQKKTQRKVYATSENLEWKIIIIKKKTKNPLTLYHDYKERWDKLLTFYKS